jgi:hypothetical protein
VIKYVSSEDSMSTIATVLRAAQEFERIRASINWVEIEKMHRACAPAMVEAQKILSQPWVADAFAAAERAFREHERLVAAAEAHRPLEIPLMDSMWPRPSPRWTPADPVDPPDQPKRRIGFAPWDE